MVVEVAISSKKAETKSALIVFHRNESLGSQALILRAEGIGIGKQFADGIKERGILNV